MPSAWIHQEAIDVNATADTNLFAIIFAKVLINYKFVPWHTSVSTQNRQLGRMLSKFDHVFDANSSMKMWGTVFYKT